MKPLLLESVQVPRPDPVQREARKFTMSTLVVLGLIASYITAAVVTAFFW